MIETHRPRHEFQARHEPFPGFGGTVPMARPLPNLEPPPHAEIPVGNSRRRRRNEFSTGGHGARLPGPARPDTVARVGVDRFRRRGTGRARCVLLYRELPRRRRPVKAGCNQCTCRSIARAPVS